MTRRRAAAFDAAVTINRGLGEETEGERKAERRARTRHVPLKGALTIKSAGVVVRSDPRVIDVAAGNVTKDGDIVTVGIPALVVVEPKSQSTAATASAGTSHVTAMTVEIALGPGTWRVTCEGSALVTNPSGQASVLIQIAGNDGAETTLNATTEASLSASHKRDGVDGGATIEVKVRYRATSAGTATARNPSATVMAVRTA